MKVPDTQECQRLMDSMQMPDHIQDHCRLVQRVAVLLSDELAVAGVTLHRSLVVAAALLHDITKSQSFITKENHAQSGCDYLTDLGYPEVGDIIRQHVVLDSYFARSKPVEAEVINYADKRVLHDRVVLLDERMTYIKERYARTVERRAQLVYIWEQTVRLEERLFAYLSFTPQQLNHRLMSPSVIPSVE